MRAVRLYSEYDTFERPGNIAGQGSLSRRGGMDVAVTVSDRDTGGLDAKRAMRMVLLPGWEIDAARQPG